MKNCKKCLQTKPLSDFRVRKATGKFYATCRQCEQIAHKVWQTNNLEWYREKNARYYQRTRTAERINVLNRTEKEKRERNNIKANLRTTRAKQARFNDELTELVLREAHDLRKLRNECTKTEWHVDHIVPLKGKQVSGLHIWSNLQVIPKIINLQKGNKYAMDAWGQEGLQT